MDDCVIVLYVIRAVNVNLYLRHKRTNVWFPKHSSITFPFISSNRIEFYFFSYPFGTRYGNGNGATERQCGHDYANGNG